MCTESTPDHDAVPSRDTERRYDRRILRPRRHTKKIALLRSEGAQIRRSKIVYLEYTRYQFP